MNRSFKTTTQSGALAEDRAQAYLLRQGLAPVVRNYRCKGGEIDLVMRAADGTLVFVEVRQRSGRSFGGAAASVTPAKQRRVLLAAGQYLATLDPTPPCRFDVVALEPGRLDWLKNAFDLGAMETDWSAAS
ncbi:YraN family protein [Cupriavidus sp. RAF12]|uniref:YraN family protein n=1 Tax=Cupriavidus sp. RAF12 TaxID=3233050 RepID=UPI003F8DCE9A